MVAFSRLALASSLVVVGTSALGLAAAAHDLAVDHVEGGGRSDQTPEELGFSEAGDSDDAQSYGKSQFSEEFCLDIGAKGFPIPTFKMLQAANWDAATYFAQLQGAGYAEDALQMTGPDAALLKSDCMKERSHGRTKHIFVGDSQMMSLRNAFHRLNKCPEIWWSNHTEQDISDMMGTVQRNDKSKSRTGSNARFYSKAEQAPGTAQLPHGCTEEGIGSFIHWDGWVSHTLPVKEIKKEMELIGVDPVEGDNVVVWVGSNFIPARHRMTALLQAINKLHEMKVKLVWDSPAYQDVALMAATTTHNEGRDERTKIPIAFNSISQRKATGQIGSNEYATEKSLYEQGIEVPTTKRWQITNRYRGLQCDGIHTDMRARDPLFYDMPCPMGKQKYGQSTFCTWVEPFKKELSGLCPWAYGLDDMVLQSGLYSMCAAHEKPFCYSYTEHIR
ncbi:unnamed protein product [Prorocentrum cordatum]|uniref:Uncharacterized protein n=1 Tax=Prorocentrum cordatum TaxID=2364126 RepID=A0ABN9T511_9DINO|nr:unnamed protein product [Polarella glacialis]CAK0840126.1 unnamed protein product [Polarella glacialis]